MASNKPLRAKVGIALDNQGSNPDAETDEVVLFKKTKGSGGHPKYKSGHSKNPGGCFIQKTNCG